MVLQIRITHAASEGASWARCSPTRIVDWGVALTLAPGQLQDVANGLYDSYWAEMAKSIQAETPNSYVRRGWEMNGNWFPWGPGLTGRNAAGHEVTNTAAQYVAAFDHVAPIFRTNCPTCKIVWCPNAGTDSAQAAEFIPSSNDFDVVGMDLYNTWEPSPVNTANETINWGYWITNYGPTFYNLSIMQQIASEYGKPMAFPEFGDGWAAVGSSSSRQVVDDPVWLNGLYAWVRQNAASVLYMGYWNSAIASSGYLGIVYPTPPSKIPMTAAAFLVDFEQ
jgi:beta-mannanase